MESKIALDPKGRVFVTGRSTTFRESPGGVANDDIAIVKYSSGGAELWARRFDGAGYYSSDTPSDIAADTDGNVYVTGTAGAAGKYITLKYDGAGNLLWSRYSGGSAYEYAAALDVDGEGNVYVTGRSVYSYGAYGNPIYQFLTVKYDSQGTQIWQRTFDTPQRQGAEAVDVKADANGNVYVTGKGYLPLEPLEQGYNVFTIKYDADGNQLWVREFAGNGPHYYNNDTPTRLRLDSEGNPSVLGSSTRAPDNSDVLVLRYTASGDLSQTFLSNQSDNELGTEWAFDSAGNCYVLALKVTRIEYSSYVFDAITMKIDAAGTVLWRKAYASSGGGNDIGRGIAVDNYGVLYVGIDAQQGTSFNQNYVLVNYNTMNGRNEFENSFDGPAHAQDWLQGMAIDGTNNIYLTGLTDRESESGRSFDFLTLKVAASAPPPEPKPLPRPIPKPKTKASG